MKYQKELIIIFISLFAVASIVHYVVYNQSLLDDKKNTATEIILKESENKEKKELTPRDTYTGVFTSKKGFEDNMIMKIDNNGTIIFEVYKDRIKKSHYGIWKINTEEELIVTVSGDPQEGDYETPFSFTFYYNTENKLIPKTYDESLYSEDELIFQKLSERELSEFMKNEIELLNQ